MQLKNTDKGGVRDEHWFYPIFLRPFRNPVVLIFPKGQRKDKSCGQKGSIHDAGGIALFSDHFAGHRNRFFYSAAQDGSGLPPNTVQTLMGTESGIRGMLLAAVTGAAALVPVLAVFPVVSELLKNGAGTAQMAVFISTLTTVGIVTIPLEVKYMGVKAAVLRKLLFFLLAFATSSLLEVLL